MIQLIKQRYIAKKDGTKHKPLMWYRPKKNYESVRDLFFNLDAHLAEIPEKDRWNLHYTLCDCFDNAEKPRIFKSQEVIPFDIDGINNDRKMEYIDPVIDAIGNINKSDIAIIDSGRGLHFIIGTTIPLTNEAEFEETRLFYKIIGERINRKLKSLNLPGGYDPAIWSKGHTLRLPGTMNIKTPETGYKNIDFTGQCRLITKVINPIPDLTVKILAGGETLDEQDYLDIKGKAIGGRYPTDAEGVLGECDFIKWCGEKQDEVKEPQWYAMLSIVGQLDNGHNLCHEMSKNHSGYSQDETDDKIGQATSCAGPRTCEKIETLWDGCNKCSHFQKLTSPISIKSKNYIKTQHTGFRDVKIVIKNDGSSYETPGKVNNGDLLKFFEKKHKYITTEAEIVYVYNGKCWDEMKDIQIEAFAEKYIIPDPAHRERKEFANKVKVNNIVNAEKFFDVTTFRKLNLNNHVVDLSGKVPKVLGHSPDFGFRTVLKYDYDPDASSERYDKFMMDITEDSMELVHVMDKLNSRPRTGLGFRTPLQI